MKIDLGTGLILKENRQKLAIANFCRGYLYLYDFLSERDYEKVHNRILKWQEKNKIAISSEQLDSVEIIYNDNPDK